ncbi:Oidioi.mRNA.OKI2018_I69.chr1.g2699.t1.cds [Oikopleura dioica]|uniref:Oidioi.mRNA.OKI2018_I69.chr1.g2699.t1.cds n=1 Tax=Oikopleura dioica TaxID=34765 RepID=A0ABN7SX57_OIKDI|nr:Oidioi.mRNA.OKI2018_I69.chr1.g2699.t1.cds [Oikopleura dioica]
MGRSRNPADIISHVESESQPKEIPWTLFLSSDRRMMRNLSRELSNSPSPSHSLSNYPQEDWSQYLNKKYDGFIQLCKDYPCRFKSPREVISHFAWIPSFSEKIGQKDEPVIEALTSYLKFLFTIQCPDSEAYRKDLKDEKAIQFLSAVIFHTISLGKKSSTKTILNNCHHVIETLAMKENKKLIESIFPGLFTFIVQTMMRPGNLNSKEFKSWLSLLRTVVITFLKSVPSEKLDKNHVEAISKAILPLLSKIIGFKDPPVLIEASSLGNELYPLIEAFQKDLFDLLCYCRSYENVHPQDISVVPKKERISKSSEYLDLFGSIFSKGNFSFILRCSAGLLDSLSSEELSLIIDIQSFISKLLNDMEPDFSTLPPIVVTECRNLRNQEEVYTQKDAEEKPVAMELSKFSPKHFSEEDLVILKNILKTILHDSLHEEIFDALLDEASIRPCSSFFLGAILLQQMTEAPENLIQVFDGLKVSAVQNRATLGENILFVHFLSEAVKLLKDNDDDICALLYSIIFYCASEHTVLANLALKSLKELAALRNSSIKKLLEEFLDPLMSTLLAKLQHLSLYPSSPRVFSALLDLLDDSSEEKVPILSSAFSEIVGFIEESNGNDLPNLNSALRALARFHKSPKDVTMDLNDLAEKSRTQKETNFQNSSKRLCECCMATLSFGFEARITISAMDILGHFLPHVDHSERLPIAAQAFSQLLGRLKLNDCRIAAKVPSVLKQLFLASGDFLDARVIDEYFPIAKTILRSAHKENFDAFSSQLKFLERNLEFLDFAFSSISDATDRRKGKFTEMKETLKMMDFTKMPSAHLKKSKLLEKHL